MKLTNETSTRKRLYYAICKGDNFLRPEVMLRWVRICSSLEVRRWREDMLHVPRVKQAKKQSKRDEDIYEFLALNPKPKLVADVLQWFSGCFHTLAKDFASAPHIVDAIKEEMEYRDTIGKYFDERISILEHLSLAERTKLKEPAKCDQCNKYERPDKHNQQKQQEQWKHIYDQWKQETEAGLAERGWKI